jgi:hypothetical protein
VVLGDWKRKLGDADLGPLKGSWNFYGHQLLKTMFLLRLEGAVAEAQELESFLRDELPNVWHNHHLAIGEFERDPKLQHLLHQQPIDGSQSEEHGRDEPLEPERDVRLGMLAARARNKK